MHWAHKAIELIKTECISHRNWSRALSEAFSLLIACNPSEVICLTGPSRAGKSRLIKELYNLIIGSPDLLPDGIMPMVSVLASNCDTGGFFSTKSFTIRCLEAIEHPLYGVNAPDDPWGIKRYKLLENTSEGVLRPALESGLKLRKAKYFVVDESQHTGRVKGGDPTAAAILDSWKCLAEDTQTILILVGAYPLLNVIKLCKHLIGRKRQLHLPRYYLDQDDLRGFGEILDFYSELIQFPPGVQSLRDWSKLLYERSFGCIGLLEGWLREALAMALAHGAPYLTKQHLLDTAKPDVELTELASEINEGEKVLRQRQKSSTKEEPPTKQTQQKSTAPTKPKKKRKPFEKRPKRFMPEDRA